MGLINVARARTQCPICLKNDWCMISEDGKLALCQRIANDHPNKKGGWWHSLSDEPYGKFEKKQRKEKADSFVLDMVYRAVLKTFPLSDEHYLQLRKRGLTQDEIYLHAYRTLPVERYKQIKFIEKHFRENAFEGVPGFCKREGKNSGTYWWIQGGSGLLIPVLTIDESGNKQVTGLQIRLDNPTDTTKYINMSTEDKDGGASCGILTHVALPNELKTNDIWITEGTIKANVLMTRLQATALGLSGVSGWHDVLGLIERIHALRGISEGNIIIAFDADYQNKEQVFYQMAQMYEHLAAHFDQTIYPIYFATWDIANGKGIDDFIMNGGFPIFKTVEQMKK